MRVGERAGHQPLAAAMSRVVSMRLSVNATSTSHAFGQVRVR
jgi:hypothetical protein